MAKVATTVSGLPVRDVKVLAGPGEFKRLRHLPRTRFNSVVDTATWVDQAGEGCPRSLLWLNTNLLLTSARACYESILERQLFLNC